MQITSFIKVEKWYYAKTALKSRFQNNSDVFLESNTPYHDLWILEK